MSQVVLAPSQREHVLAQLDRRLQKLSDNALIELERLTRYPERISDFVPHQVTVLETEPRALTTPSRRHSSERIEALDYRSVSRRELLTYVAGGGMALLAGATGYAWSSSQNRFTSLLALFDQMEACGLDQIVSEAIRGLDGQIEELENLTEATSQKANNYDSALSEYQEQFRSLQRSVARLEDVTSQMRSRCNHLEELGETGATLVQDAISQFLQFVPGAENFATALDVMSEIVRNTSLTVDTTESALVNLRTWFPAEQGQGIDVNLFQPLSDDLIEGVNEIARKTVELNETLDSTLVEPAEEALRERHRLRGDISDLG